MQSSSRSFTFRLTVFCNYYLRTTISSIDIMSNLLKEVHSRDFSLTCSLHLMKSHHFLNFSVFSNPSFTPPLISLLSFYSRIESIRNRVVTQKVSKMPDVFFAFFKRALKSQPNISVILMKFAVSFRNLECIVKLTIFQLATL